MQVKYRSVVFCFAGYFSFKFAEIAFVSLMYDSVPSSHVIAELSIIRAKYLLFSQLHVAGLQI